MNLIVSHQSLLNARVSLLLFTEEHRSLYLFFYDVKLISGWQEETAMEAREKEQNNYGIKRREKSKSAFTETTDHWTVTS